MVVFLTLNICRKLSISLISSSQWNTSLVKIFLSYLKNSNAHSWSAWFLGVTQKYELRVFFKHQTNKWCYFFEQGWGKFRFGKNFLKHESPTLITRFIWYLEKEKRYESLSTNIVLDKEHLYKKTVQKMCTKANPTPLFNFGK